MQSGTDILSYRGDKNLGAGSNANIPAIDPRANLDIINRAARDITMLNHENNIKLYQQKINDRDTALNMLAKGEIASGKISDADRKYYDAGKEEMEKSFYDMISKGGINNPEAYKDFLNKASNLSNIATWAQGRELELSKLEQERASQTLPSDIAAYDKHIEAQKSKDFWQPITPFQKAFDFNLPSMQSSIAGTAIEGDAIGQLDANGNPVTTITKTTTDKNGFKTNSVVEKTVNPRSGLITNGRSGKAPISITGSQVNEDGTISPISYTPEKYWDLDTMIRNANEECSFANIYLIVHFLSRYSHA